MSDKNQRKQKIIAYSGIAALVVLGIKLITSSVHSRRQKLKCNKEITGSNVHVNLSALEIKKLTEHIIAKSKAVYDSVASVQLEKVTYANVIAPLVELEAYQFPLVQSCLIGKMVSCFEDVRKASAAAEERLDSFFSMCRKREDVYCVIKAFFEKGEWLGAEAKRYVQCLMKDFERNGVNLTVSKRKEMDSIRSQIGKLSSQYVQNLNGDNSFLLLRESELNGMPQQFMKSLEVNENGMLKVLMKSHHVSPILEHCKVGATRKSVAIAFRQRCGKENLVILDSLVQLRHKFARLLGYANYADYAIEPRMMKNSAKFAIIFLLH